MSVPALTVPTAQSPSTPQKTITQLLTQWVDLTNAAIAATGDTQDWEDDLPLATSKLWDPADENVGLAPCHIQESDNASRVQAAVYHAPFEPDPHPVADKLTAYWESQGFAVTRTVDWTNPAGEQSVLLRAERPDGVSYGLDATNDLVAIDVYTECSAHPSIHAWAEARMQKRLDDLPTYTPEPSPSTSRGRGRTDTGNPTTAATISGPSDLSHEDADSTTASDSTESFREDRCDAVDHAAPAPPSDPTDLFDHGQHAAEKDDSPPATGRTANDYNWRW